MAITQVPIAVMMATIQFLDAVDRPWTGAALQVVTVLLNVPLNYMLIWGVGPVPALGLLGAGLGSLIAGILAVVVTLAYLHVAQSLAAYRTPPTFPGLGRCLARDGLPLALGYTSEGAAYAVVGLMLGLFGAVALAANQIVQSVGGLLYMLPLGMSAAVAIRVGQAAGAGEEHRLRAIAKAAIGIVAMWMLAATAGLLVGGGAIARALSADPAVVALPTSMFITVALIQVADGVQGTSLGALRGTKDFRWPTVVTLLCYWLFALPLAWLLGIIFNHGPIGVWIGYGIGLSLVAIVLPVRFWCLTRQK